MIFATKGRIFFARAPPVHTDGLAPNACQKRLLLAMAQKHCLPSFQRRATPMAGSPVKQPQYSLENVALFRGLPQPILSRIKSRCLFRRYGPGEPVVGHLYTSDEVYFLWMGGARDGRSTHEPASSLRFRRSRS